MDWLLTVPLLLMELVLVMDMSKEEKQKQSAVLGFFAAMMIAVGYPGEMITQGPFGTRSRVSTLPNLRRLPTMTPWSAADPERSRPSSTSPRS